MPLSINTNISSLNANLQANRRSSALNRSFEQLSSGRQINRASDNPAGLAVALDLLAQADTGTVASRNISDGVSVANIAEAGLESSSNITSRLEELAVQASNGTLSDSQRSALNDEFQALSSELDRISQTTEFNGNQLLSSDSSIDIQAGTDGSADSSISISLTGVSSSSLGIASDISTVEGARSAIGEVQSARESINETRGSIGASVNRLETAFNNLQSSEINQREAASRILDVDVASATADNVANKIGQQAALAVQAQANQQPSIAQRLLS